MTREIKFRAWDKKRKLFIGNDLLFVLADCALYNSSERTIELKNGLQNPYISDVKNQLEMDLIFLQYTSLKDKNGREIFEGDIIAHQEQVMSHNGKNLPNFIDIRIEPNYKYYDGSIGERRWGRKIEVVKWEKSSCGFEPFSDSQSNCGHCGGGINPNDIEVIGNIYQNKDLIDN